MPPYEGAVYSRMKLPGGAGHNFSPDGSFTGFTKITGIEVGKYLFGGETQYVVANGDEFRRQRQDSGVLFSPWSSRKAILGMQGNVTDVSVFEKSVWLKH